MRRSPHPVLAATALAAAALGAALPASTAAASWTAPRAATSAGTSFTPSVAADDRGRIALGFVRELGSADRAEVRRGTTRALLRGGSIVVDRTRSISEAVVALEPGGGPLAVAWRRVEDRAQRLRATTVDDAGRFGAPQPLTADGPESAYEPTFVAAADGSLRLVWSRRTSQSGRPVLGSGFGAPFALPAPGVGTQPQVAVDGDGTTVVVWVDIPTGHVLTASAPAGGTFGPTATLSATGRARDPQLTVSASDAVVAAWTRSVGTGNSVQAAVRPRGGAFGAPLEIAEPAQRAFAPRLAATSAGEVLVAWVNTRVGTGFGGGPGIVRARRLTAHGQPVGSRLRLSPDGVRADEAALAHDGTGSTIAAWTAFPTRGRAGTVQARRIAPDGITGAVRALSRGTVALRSAPALAGAGGRAVAAWTQGGDVRYSVYR
jgi:hypothetical protein